MEEYLDGRLYKLLSESFNIEANFGNEEKKRLIGHYKNGDLKEYFLLIISNVLPKKQIALNNDEIISSLLDKLTNIPPEKINVLSDDDIINFAEICYKTLMLIDLNNIYKK